MEINLANFQAFLSRAGAATYVGGGRPVSTPERSGFIELVYTEDQWAYRDSYVGHARSRGTEVVRYNGMPVWCSLYGGGMVTGYEQYADEAFAFLKDALSRPSRMPSIRGPQQYMKGDLAYSYQQHGDIDEFTGHEEITRNGKLVFFHEVTGGWVVNN